MIPELYGRVGVLVLFGIVFPAIPLLASFAFYMLKLRPENPDPVKSATYECGVEAEGNAWGQFNARYYLFALGFVIFDVEVVFLYPVGGGALQPQHRRAVQGRAVRRRARLRACLRVATPRAGLALACRPDRAS